jgi:SnoaL-like domain
MNCVKIFMTHEPTELLEREHIRQVLATYCLRLDEGDIAGVIACFTEDAIADYGPGRGGLVVGAGAIGERIARGQSTFRRTHHQLGQIHIECAVPEARALSYVTAWHERYSGEREVVCLRYIDLLKKAGSQWAIATRRVETSFVDGFPGTDWNWVARGPTNG